MVSLHPRQNPPRKRPFRLRACSMTISLNANKVGVETSHLYPMILNLYHLHSLGTMGTHRGVEVSSNMG